MAPSSQDRAQHIKERIQLIRHLLADKPFNIASAEPTTWAAFERYLEIVSEAARNLPQSWKAEHADIPWVDIENIGNIIRHVYHRTLKDVLWDTYLNDLDPLEAAIDAMIAAHGPASKA